MHTKEDFCGEPTNIAPTNPPEGLNICGESTTTTTTTKSPSAYPSTSTTTSEPSRSPVTESPSAAPIGCVTYPPTRAEYYDCNADFISDSDCFDGDRYTCESCCYTDYDVFGTRPCWTVMHTKADCCGTPTDIAPTNPPNINICPPTYDSLCECISANNLCMEKCDQLAS